MAFLIPDNMRSRKDVPKAARDVAAAFQVGLDDTVTVWFEPLFDPSGDAPDFVLLDPQRGVVVVALEDMTGPSVLGVIRGEIHQAAAGGGETVRTPATRAEGFAAMLRLRVGAQPELNGTPVVAGVAFSSVSREEARTTGLEAAVDIDGSFFADDLDSARAGDGEAQLQRIMARLIGTLASELRPDQLDRIRGLMHPDTIIAAPSGNETGVQLPIFSDPGDSDVIRVMDRRQEAMAKSLGSGHRVIRGVAGSGKTLILIYRARLLARNFPQRRLLLTCYGRALAGHLRRMLENVPNVEVAHIDRIASRFVRDAGMRHPGYEDGGDAFWRMALTAQAQLMDERYDGVLVDEAQDFSTDMLRFARGLLKDPNDGDLVIVADAAQKIFKTNFSWQSAGIRASGRTRILRINYRNTKEILGFAHAFLLSGGTITADDTPEPEDENAVIAPTSARRSGPHPDIQLASDDVRAVVRTVSDWLSGEDGADRIGVLYCTSSACNPSALRDGLETRGIDVFWATDDNSRDAKDLMAQARERVILSTVQSAKGMEFPRVVLTGLWRDDADDDENIRTAYVGMTRAQNLLTVVHPPDGPAAAALKTAGATRDAQDPAALTRAGSFSEVEPFAEGSRVRHPTRGLGTVIALRGGRATVRFDSEEERTYDIRYGHVALTPAPGA